MAEKADLPSDTVSLPPNYAPSETYTESPPPAYKKSGMTAVRVARIVCFTLLAMTFVIGFFVVMHNWVENRSGNCPQVHTAEESKNVRHAALLAQLPNLPNSDLNNNKIEEDIEKEDSSNYSEGDVLPAEVEEEIIPKEQMPPKNTDKVEDMTPFEKPKELSLPKDLLLGNPKLAGRNVHCKMEKRQRKIAEGIMTQAIIVTCDDDEDDENDDGKLPMPIVPVRPPLSLLNTIMKVLSARPRSNEEQPAVEPRPMPFQPKPFNGQLPFPVLHPINGRLPFPFPGPLPAGINIVPVRKLDMRRPFPDAEESESNGPRFAHGPIQIINEGRQPRMNELFNPRIIMQRPQENNVQIQRIPFPFENNGQIQRIPFPFENNGQIQRIPFPLENNVQIHRIPFSLENNGQIQRIPFPLENNGQIQRIPFQLENNGQIQRLPFPLENNVQIQRLPFPLNAGPLPIRMIRLSPRRNEILEEENQPISREEEENESPMPFPLHPLIKLLPARRRRIIRFNPNQQSLGSVQDEPIPFPLPRGALPLRHPSDEPIPHPMPEASGRALPAPVALPGMPGVRVVRLPFRPQPQPFPEARVITHMEVRQPTEEEEEEDSTTQEPQNTFDNALENKNFSPDNLEFGPPKIHSVLENSPSEDGSEDDSSPPEPIHQEPITQTQSQPRFVAPPPPRYAREGRTSLFAQLNPDAEVIATPQQQEPASENQEPTIHKILIN